MTFEHSNKYKVLAAAVAIVLHGMVGVGLATMQMLHIEPPKITPPLEIQMIKLNTEESPTPPTPMPAPEPTPTPSQSVAAPAPPKVSPPPPTAPKPKLEPKKESPKPKPTKPEPPKPKPKEPPRVTEPQVDIIAQERAQKAFELRQQREREQREREQQERERQAELDRQAKLARQKAEADAKARAEADARAKAKAEADARAEADAKARAIQGQGKGGDGRDTKTDNKTGNKDTTKSGGTGGGELKGQNLGTVSNASWKSRPNWNGLTSEKLSGSANFVATLTIDANGKITSVSGVNTGDKGLDRQISQALRRARLHPFKSSSGHPMSGTATFSTTVQF